MPDSNEENIRSKKDKKLSKHFDILINDKKVKILNYQFKDYKTSTESGQVIEFISQMKFDKAEKGEVIIKINTLKEELTINGKWKIAWDGPGSHGTSYLIKKIIKE
ncbi:MAG: hypothetical protein HXX09_15925 [Bacteroidetes bacterium]|nr:hypothetical protein [Bacteroidota bacterium]